MLRQMLWLVFSVRCEDFLMQLLTNKFVLNVIKSLVAHELNVTCSSPIDKLKQLDLDIKRKRLNLVRFCVQRS
jgi:hypothetical protein